MTFDDWFKTQKSIDPLVEQYARAAWDAAQQARWTSGNMPPAQPPYRRLITTRDGMVRIDGFYSAQWDNSRSEDVIAYADLPAPYKPEVKS